MEPADMPGRGTESRNAVLDADADMAEEAGAAVLLAWANISGRNRAPCICDVDHCLNRDSTAGVGGAMKNVFSPATRWYQTDVPPKSTWKSV